MYINEKDFNSIVETYIELSECVNHLEKYLRNIGRCLDNIERDNKEKIEKESSWYSNKCDDCTCEKEKEQPKSDINYSKIDFDKILDEDYGEMLKIIIDGFKKDLTNQE